MSTQILKWAYGPSHELMFIDRVENGLKCNCSCPACGVRLNARNKGLIREHHFAHADQSNCRVAPETLLHLRMKQLLASHNEITLPWIQEDHLGSRYASRTVSYQLIDVEKKQSEIIPDLIIKLETGDIVFIEVKVTHGVSEEKLQKVKNMHASMLEIDVSNMNDVEDENLMEQILKYESNKRWIYTEIEGVRTMMIDQQKLEFGDPEVSDIISLWKNHNVCFGGLFQNIVTKWFVFIDFDPELKRNERGVIYGRFILEDKDVVTKSKVIDLAEIPQWKFISCVKSCSSK